MPDDDNTRRRSRDAMGCYVSALMWCALALGWLPVLIWTGAEGDWFGILIVPSFLALLIAAWWIDEGRRRGN
jgi:hypothetical protein